MTDKIALVPFKTYHHAWKGDRGTFEDLRHFEQILMSERGKTNEEMERYAIKSSLDVSPLSVRTTIADAIVGNFVDIGCGEGDLLAKMSRNNLDNLGVELSKIQMNKAQKKWKEKLEHSGMTGKDLNIVHDNGKSMPLKDGQFKTSILADVIRFDSQPGSLINEAFRVASERVIITAPIGKSGPGRFKLISCEVVDDHVVLVFDKLV